MNTPKNRGKESGDDALFGSEKIRASLQNAVEDLSYLMTRGYSQKSPLALVGNRYQLNIRQQRAVQGMSASLQQIEYRTKNSLGFADLENQEVAVDGFNVLILLESLLSEAYVFKGVDGFYRDLSSVHGSYKKVQQTARAIELIAEFYVQAKIKKMYWYFDKPVSNSGKLKQMIAEIAAENGYDWEVFLTFNPDKDIAGQDKVAISSDAWILDNSKKNFNLAGFVAQKCPSASIISFKLGFC